MSTFTGGCRNNSCSHGHGMLTRQHTTSEYTVSSTYYHACRSHQLKEFRSRCKFILILYTESGNPATHSFGSLLHEIAKLPSRTVTTPRSRTYNHSYPALDIFRRWVSHLRNRFSPLPSGSTSIIFRLLFPEEDIRRKYDMQETRLAQCLAECLGVNAQKLERWCLQGSSGCLGKELEITLEKSCPVCLPKPLMPLIDTHLTYIEPKGLYQFFIHSSS